MTRTQRRVMLVIQSYADRGECPRLTDIMQAIGASSKSVVWNALRSLETDGYISRLPNRWQAITIKRRIVIDHYFSFNDATKALEPWHGPSRKTA